MLRFKQFILEFYQLLEDRIDFLKQNFEGKLNTDHDPYGVHKTTNDIVDHFSTQADPTKNKVHTQWILKQYQRGKIRQEDHPRIKQTLSDFEQHKNKLTNKDINSYKSLGDIEDAVAPHIDSEEPISKRQETKRVKDEGSEIVHSEPDFTVRKLKSKEAACHYGAGTKWCTAAKNEGNNMFDYYNKDGPLYVIHHKDETGAERKYQYHPASDQFMDEKDDEVSMDKFIEDHPEMKNVKDFQGYHRSIPLDPENKKRLQKEFHDTLDNNNMLSDVKDDKINKTIDNAYSRGYLHPSHIAKITADDRLGKSHYNLTYHNKYNHLDFSPEDISNIAKAKNSTDAHQMLASKHHETLGNGYDGYDKQNGYPTLSNDDISQIMNNPISKSAHKTLVDSHAIHGNVLTPEHLDSVANNPTAYSAHSSMIKNGLENEQQLNTIINNPNSTDAHRRLIDRHLDLDSYPSKPPKLTDDQLSGVLKHGKILDSLLVGRLLDHHNNGHIKLNDEHIEHLINKSNDPATSKVVAHVLQGDSPNQKHVELLRKRLSRET